MGVYNDEYDGVGGSYKVVNGKRVRVPEEGEQPAPAGQEPAQEPAKQPAAEHDDNPNGDH